MWDLNHKLVSITNKKQTQNKLAVTSGEREREGQDKGWGLRGLQTIMYKISCKHILFTTGDTAYML